MKNEELYKYSSKEVVKMLGIKDRYTFHNIKNALKLKTIKKKGDNGQLMDFLKESQVKKVREYLKKHSSALVVNGRNDLEAKKSKVIAMYSKTKEDYLKEKVEVLSTKVDDSLRMTNEANFKAYNLAKYMRLYIVAQFIIDVVLMAAIIVK